jgi:hypothetical protein
MAAKYCSLASFQLLLLDLVAVAGVAAAVVFLLHLELTSLEVVASIH